MRTREMKYRPLHAKITIGVQTAGPGGNSACSPNCSKPPEINQNERATATAEHSASTVLHFTHANCMDGATCDALVRAAYGDGAVETVFLEPHETADAHSSCSPP